MRICFVSREYPPEHHIGGIATFSSHMAFALKEIGHRVSVITPTNNKAGIFEENGILVHRISYKRMVPKELAYLMHSYSVAKEISRIEDVVDVVCCPEFYSDAFYYSFQKKVPLVTRLATPLCIAQKYQQEGYLKGRPLFQWMEKKQTLNSNGVFTSTKALADTVKKEWKRQDLLIEIIPNSVDVKQVIKLGESPFWKERSPKGEYMIFFGRLEERKGVHVIADALTRVFEEFPDLHMVFIGADTLFNKMSMREYILSRIPNQYKHCLLFLNNLPHEELFPLVNHARLAILPSLWEGFGFVSIEAMALGKVVIATNGSGFDEIIEDGKSGFLVPPGQNEVLAEKILYCLSSKDEMVQIEKNAAKRALEFDVNRMAARVADYFSYITESGKNSKVSF